MALSLEGIADFVKATLDSHVVDKWVDISMPLQKYYFASRFMDPKKASKQGGVRLNWKLRVANQGTAKVTGLYAVDDTNKVNVLAEAKQGWSFQTVNYIYDVREDAFQEGPNRIIQMMKLNEQGLYNDFYALMETLMWTAPSSSALDPMTPCGIPYWLQKNATLGFTGADPSGWTDGAGGLATATYPKWKNYSGTYVTVSRDDLIEKVVNAMDFTYFMPVKPYAEIGGGAPDYGLCTVHSVLATMRKLLEANNDNLGNEVAWGAKGQGTVNVRGIPVEWVPALDNSESAAVDTSNPFYGINWNKFEWFYRSGQNMVKQPPKQAAHQHLVYERHMDNSGNFVCYDRRQGGFVFYVA